MTTNDTTLVSHRVRLPSVYLAARFARRDELRVVAAELSDVGFDITSRWLDSPAPLSTRDLDDPQNAALLAEMDFEDVCRAGICIAFTEAASHPQPGRGGRHTELGIALGTGLRVMLVGPREHVFHCLPAIEHYECWSDALEVLKRERARAVWTATSARELRAVG